MILARTYVPDFKVDRRNQWERWGIWGSRGFREFGGFGEIEGIMILWKETILHFLNDEGKKGVETVGKEFETMMEFNEKFNL